MPRTAAPTSTATSGPTDVTRPAAARRAPRPDPPSSPVDAPAAAGTAGAAGAVVAGGDSVIDRPPWGRPRHGPRTPSPAWGRNAGPWRRPTPPAPRRPPRPADRSPRRG